MVATLPCEILEANMLPPTTAIDVHIVCPIVAPIATPTAFLWVANFKKISINNKTGLVIHSFVTMFTNHNVLSTKIK